jgi:hypothetical protein
MRGMKREAENGEEDIKKVTRGKGKGGRGGVGAGYLSSTVGLCGHCCEPSDLR